MNKALISLMIVLLFLMVSCGVEDEDVGNTGNTGNTGETGNTSDTGNTGPYDIGTMVDVLAGEFQMGCNEAVDDQCGSDESPYHAVTLSAYKIDKYEVTAGEYQKCVDAGDCNNSNEIEPHYYAYSEEDSCCNLGATGKGDHPMNCVNWYGAKAYCEWAGKRLPTEAEWEKAARGTDGRKYPWGNEPEVSCEYAVINDSNAGGNGCGTYSTWIVGSIEKGKSPYGAYDMIGNVWEWVNDWYGSDYYETAPSENPTGPESGDRRVVRGGSWNNSYGNSGLRASSRGGNDPDNGIYLNGFRCAK